MRTLAVLALVSLGCVQSVELGLVSRKAQRSDVYEALGPVEGRDCNRPLHAPNLRDAVVDAERKIPGSDAIADATVTFRTGIVRGCTVVNGEAVTIGRP